jgi:hypothetical protein
MYVSWTYGVTVLGHGHSDELATAVDIDSGRERTRAIATSDSSSQMGGTLVR